MIDNPLSFGQLMKKTSAAIDIGGVKALAWKAADQARRVVRGDFGLEDIDP